MITIKDTIVLKRRNYPLSPLIVIQKILLICDPGAYEKSKSTHYNLLPDQSWPVKNVNILTKYQQFWQKQWVVANGRTEKEIRNRNAKIFLLLIINRENYGYELVGFFKAATVPTRSKTWFSKSAAEWIASEKITSELV